MRRNKNRLSKIILYKSKYKEILSKPEHFRYPCETDNLFVFNDIIENSTRRDQHEINENYLHNRKELIKYVGKSCRNFKFSDETFHQTVDYLDTILSSKSQIKLNFGLIAIGCILLAGKYLINIYSKY